MSYYIYSIPAQVAQSKDQLIEHLTWKDGHNRRLFTIFRKLRSSQEKGSFNDTHMENLRSAEFSTKIYWNTKLTASDVFSYVYTINWVLLIPLSYSCLKNVIRQIDSKNEWLHLSVTFTAKVQLGFILTFENAFS